MAATIDENLSRLSDILAVMEQGQLTLEESLSHFEEGVRLVRECRSMIDTVEKRIKVLEAQEDHV